MSHKLPCSVWPLAGAIICWAMDASAQTQSVNTTTSATDGLEEIVVTAERRQENLQDVPVSVSALSGADLAKRGILETTDLSGSIPNLQVNSPYGSTQPNFTLRGVGLANEFNANAASPIGVYVDDVYQAFRASHGQQLFDVDRIEVLRGPQGTLYGRNTTGGAVSFFSRQPDLEGDTNGYASVGAGNYGRYSAEGALGVTLIPGELGLRIAGTYEHTNGFINNLIGPDGGGSDHYGLRAILRYKIGIADISLKLFSGQEKGEQALYIVSNTNPNNTGPITFGPLGQAFGLSYDRHDLNSTTVSQDTAGGATTRDAGGVLRAAFAFSDKLSFTSISGYDTGVYAQAPTDCDGSPLDVCDVGYNAQFYAFNQELRVNYERDDLKFVGGLYYGFDKISPDNQYHLYGLLDSFRQAFGLPATYFNPAGFGVIPNPMALPTPIDTTESYTQTRLSKAIYGEAVYDVTKRLAATLGLRYTKDKDNFENGEATLFDSTGAARLVSVSAVSGLVPVGAGVVPLNLSRGSDALSGRAILSYKIADQVLGFLSYSRGYRAGSFNGTAFQDKSQVNFVPPEILSDYEMGIKSRFLDNKVQVNGSFFYYDYKGQQVDTVVGARSLTALGSLDGKIKGAELETQYRPTARLQFAVSVGYLDSRYDNDQLLSGIEVGGNRFPFAPSFSYDLSLDYDVLYLTDGKITLHGDDDYTGQYYYDPFGHRQATGLLAKGSSDYSLVNGRLSYVAHAFTVSAWVKNLTDKIYYPYALNLESGFGVDLLVRGTPRTFGVDATINF